MKQYFRLGLLFGCLIFAGCQSLLPGGERERQETAVVHAFADANRNGQQDAGEVDLPDILIASQSNIHGEMTFNAKRTNSDGVAEFSATYTHFFDLEALLPCGYEATTPTSLAAEKNVLFGFAPMDPQAGSAQLTILLWHDENQDGVQQSGEIPVAGETLLFDPGLSWGFLDGIVMGSLTAVTDSNGVAAVNFGNHCGVAVITIRGQWQPVSHSGDGDWQEGRYHIAYQPGHTDISLGIIPKE